MNKYLMMSAAALMATTTAAKADEWKKSGSATILFNSYCDYLKVNWDGYVYADQHIFSQCGSNVTAYGIGISGKTKGIGENIFLMDDGGVQVYGTNILLGFDLILPFKTGNAFYGWASFSGVTAFNYISGTYTVGHKAISANGNARTFDKLQALIRAHGNAAHRVK